MNFGGKFVFKGKGNYFRSFFKFNIYKNFRLFGSQPIIVNLFNGIHKRNCFTIISSGTLITSLSFLSNGSMTNSDSQVSIKMKNLLFLELIEEFFLFGDISLNKYR